MMSKKFQIGMALFSLIVIIAFSFIIVADAQKTKMQMTEGAPAAATPAAK